MKRKASEVGLRDSRRAKKRKKHNDAMKRLKERLKREREEERRLMSEPCEYCKHNTTQCKCERCSTRLCESCSSQCPIDDCENRICAVGCGDGDGEDTECGNCEHDVCGEHSGTCSNCASVLCFQCTPSYDEDDALCVSCTQFCNHYTTD